MKIERLPLKSIDFHDLATELKENICSFLDDEEINKMNLFSLVCRKWNTGIKENWVGNLQMQILFPEEHFRIFKEEEGRVVEWNFVFKMNRRLGALENKTSSIEGFHERFFPILKQRYENERRTHVRIRALQGCEDDVFNSAVLWSNSAALAILLPVLTLRR